MKKRLLPLTLVTALVLTATACDNIKLQPAPQTSDATTTASEIVRPPLATENVVIQGYGTYIYEIDLRKPTKPSELESISFESLGEMKDRFIYRGLTESDIATIRYSFSQNEKGEYVVPDMFNLQSPVMPGDYQLSNLELTAEEYYFRIESGEDSDENTDGYFYVYLSDEIYEDAVESGLRDYSGREGYQISHTDDRDAEVIDFTSKDGKSQDRWLRYTITTPEKTLMVEEEYSIKSEYSEGSETIPRHILIFGEEGDVRYSVFLLEVPERPSVEWLSSIGVEKYEDTDDLSPQ